MIQSHLNEEIKLKGMMYVTNVETKEKALEEASREFERVFGKVIASQVQLSVYDMSYTPEKDKRQFLFTVHYDHKWRSGINLKDMLKI